MESSRTRLSRDYGNPKPELNGGGRALERNERSFRADTTLKMIDLLTASTSLPRSFAGRHVVQSVWRAIVTATAMTGHRMPVTEMFTCVCDNYW